MTKDILYIENLVAGYNGKPVLKGVNLTVGKGEICCVIGEEGSGKSTFVKSLTRQIPATGIMNYNGINLASADTGRMIHCGVDFIIQGGNILKEFTVEEHIQLALPEKRNGRQNSMVWEEIEATFPQMVKLRKQVAGRLSGGERMLLSLSCLLATDAGLWLLDEPTAGLAPEICTVIGGFLLRMKHERQKTILMMEHNYDFAFEVSDTVVTLKGGLLSHKYQPDEFRQKNFVDEKLYDANDL